MTTEAFNTAANAPQPYVFDLEREVAGFYRDHPEQKKAIFFIDASTMPGALYRGDEADEDEVAELLAKNGDLSDAVSETYKTGVCGAVRYNEENYSCVILKTPRNRKDVSLLGYSTPSDVADLFSFDHESGHLVCPGGYEGDPRMKECIADAYAVIRHFQRFGADAVPVKNLPAMRMVEMIFGRDDSHFTAPVVEQIIADSRKTDFSALTPAETAALAQRYAVDNAPEAKFLSYMLYDFGQLRFRGAEIMQGDFRALRELGAFLMETTVAKEFKWGALAARALLDGDISIDGVHLPKPAGPAWTKLRQAIDARAAKFGQSHAKPAIPGQ